MKSFAKKNLLKFFLSPRGGLQPPQPPPESANGCAYLRMEDPLAMMSMCITFSLLSVDNQNCSSEAGRLGLKDYLVIYRQTV